MKKFLIKISLYSLVALLLHLFVGFLADGHTDAYYAKISSGKKESLVIGTSRSAQGIIPSILENYAGLKENSLYNFSFTVSHSPFGSIYLNQIKKKLSEASDNQVFILSVDPWSLSSVKGDPNNEDKFFEKDLFLSNLNNNTSDPNYEYLIKHYGYGWGKLLLNKKANKAFDFVVHEDGWLDVNIPSDSISIASRTKKKVDTYRNEKLPVNEISEKRLEYLEASIEFLNTLGNVILVRLPVGEEIKKMEDILDPSFNRRMEDIATKNDILYRNYIEVQSELGLTFTDGNHLDRKSAKSFSAIFGTELEHYLNQIQ